MAVPWIPPIPGGKLTSKPARKLGSAIIFLLWCYEAVQRDGTIEFQISDVAGYLDESYYTVRKWWADVKDGPWFTEVIDRGKRGFRVHMADEWLEWRSIKSPSNDGQVPKNALDDGSVPDRGSVKSRSTRDEMHNQVLESSAYKVLIDSDQADHEREREDQDRTARSLSHPAVAAYTIAFPSIRLTEKQAAIISALVGEGVERLECWQEVIQDYELSPQWKPENIGNMRSRFDIKLKERSQRNGTHHHGRQPDRRPDLATRRTRQRYDLDD